MRFDWDDSKSELLKRDRGLSLEECAEMFLVGHVSDQKSDVPEQYFAIGFVQGQLITLIYEYRQNEDRRDYLANNLLEGHQKRGSTL